MADNANTQQQAKVLRIGVVQGGKVVHERLIKPGQNVTIGESPKNTFVFAAEGLPKRFTLFQAKGSTYVLNFTEQMTGKVQQPDGIVGLDQVRQGTDGRRGGQNALPLTLKTRGKVMVGDVTVLFQFVAAPPESARKLARQDFRPKLLEEDDPVFLGFLALWSAVAAVLMIYVWNTEPVELVNLDEIPDRFVTILQAPSEDKPPPEEVKPEEDPNIEGEKVKKEEEKAEVANKDPKNKDEAVAEAKRIEKKREDAIAKSKLLAGLIGTRGENNSGKQIEDVFAEGDANFQDLQSALQTVDGAGVASEQTMAMKGSTQGGGRGDSSIGDLNTSGGGGSSSVGTVASAAPKKVSATLGTMDVASGESADAIRDVVKKYQGQIKSCYDQQLKVNPNLSGRVAVSVEISAGRVTTVVVEENSTGDENLGSCITKRIRGWRFPTEVTDSLYLPFALNAS